MPFLRFTRDKRGYETTSLVHSSSGRQGPTREQLLYWFRTPPSVKVGRPALDEEAIRWIEEHNPDIEFDWPKILESAPPPAPLTDEAKARRSRRAKTDRRSAAPQRPAPRRSQAPPAPAPPVKPLKPLKPLKEEAPEPPGQPGQSELNDAVLAQLTHPDVEELPPPTVSAVEAAVGREQLFRLRARYAELQARITERGGEAANSEALRAQAEQLNPDSWVTAEEARKGLAEFESKIRDLRAALGLRRRRRSRRGGRRRRGGRQEQAGQEGLVGLVGQTPGADASSNSPETRAPLEGEPDDGEEEDEGGEAG